MDPNVTNSFGAETKITSPDRAKRIVIFDLSDETHGSAVGIGNGDITTKRLVDKMDRDATYPNVLTVAMASPAKIPMYFDTQELAVKAAIKTLVGADKSRLRIVRIPDTLHLEKIWVSEAMLDEVRSDPSLEILEEAMPMAFNENGNLF